MACAGGDGARPGGRGRLSSLKSEVQSRGQEEVWTAREEDLQAGWGPGSPPVGEEAQLWPYVYEVPPANPSLEGRLEGSKACRGGLAGRRLLAVARDGTTVMGAMGRERWI